MVMEKKPAISVIIPAHNEAKYLHRPLNSLKKQTFKDFETIVIADSCTDKTVQVAKRYGCEVKKTKAKNVGKNRNIGAKLAKADILVFLDADVRVSDNYLEKIINAVEQGFGCGRPDYYSDSKNMIIRNLYFIINIFRLHYYPHTSFVKKEYFVKIGGFNENFKNCYDDMIYSECIKKICKPKVLSAKAFNSDRRYMKIGLIGEFKTYIISNYEYFFLVRILKKVTKRKWIIHR